MTMLIALFWSGMLVGSCRIRTRRAIMRSAVNHSAALIYARMAIFEPRFSTSILKK